MCILIKAPIFFNKLQDKIKIYSKFLINLKFNRESKSKIVIDPIAIYNSILDKEMRIQLDSTQIENRSVWVDQTLCHRPFSVSC